jgi:hypothetical protein
VRNGAVTLDDIADDSPATRTISGGNATRTNTFADRMGKCMFALKLRTSTLMQNNRASLFLSLHSNSSVSPLPPLEFPSVKLHPLIIKPQTLLKTPPIPSAAGYRLSHMWLRGSSNCVHSLECGKVQLNWRSITVICNGRFNFKALSDLSVLDVVVSSSRVGGIRVAKKRSGKSAPLVGALFPLSTRIHSPIPCFLFNYFFILYVGLLHCKVEVDRAGDSWHSLRNIHPRYRG